MALKLENIKKAGRPDTRNCRSKTHCERAHPP